MKFKGQFVEAGRIVPSVLFAMRKNRPRLDPDSPAHAVSE
jgi:hypothetical protein